MTPIARLLNIESFPTTNDSLKASTGTFKRIKRDLEFSVARIITNSNCNESRQAKTFPENTTWNFWSPSSILVNSFMKYCSVVTTHTGSKYDLSIDGNGLFAIRKKNKLCFTRKGDFTLDARRKLITKTGYDVLNRHNNPIFIPPAQDFTISKTGEIFVEQQRISKIKIVNFANLSGLTAKGDIIFAEYLVDIYPKLSADFSIRQGYLEMSNTNIIKEVIESFSVFYSYIENTRLEI